MDQRGHAQAKRFCREGVPAGFRTLLILALMFLPGQGRLGAQASVELPGFDFPAGGGWRARAGQIQFQRQSLLREQSLGALNGPAAPRVAGTLRLAVIPVLFPGQQPPWPVATYQQRLFATAPSGNWSMTSFYRVQSRGALNLEGKVFDWVTLPHPEAYYADGCNGIGAKSPCPLRERPRMLEFLIDALDRVAPGAGGPDAWRGFDNDGPDDRPDSGDDDGVVDLVVFLHPSIDGACGTDALWAHRYGLSSWGLPGGYQTRTPRSGRPGEYLRVDSYTLQSAVGGEDSCTGNQPMTIGTLAHETGHALGLPDLYDTDPASATSGIGEWGLMGAGNYSRPYSPASFSAWSLVELGWVKVDTLVSGRGVVTGPVQTSDTVFLARSSRPGWWFLLENRQAVGSDTAGFNPLFNRARTPGLLIWRVDSERLSEGRFLNRVNTGPRQGIALMEADGLSQLRHNGPGRNRGDAGDSWPGPGGANDFGLATTPAALGWNGESLDIRIDRIARLTQGRISFRYTRQLPTLVATRQPAGLIRFGKHTGNSILEVLAPGDTVPVATDSLQMSLDGRSILAFLGWSDGGAREHLIVAQPGMNSLWADFAVRHRVRVTVDGPGEVHSSAGAFSGLGIFLPQDSVISLTAMPGRGTEFLGWRGDSTSLSPSLTMTVERAMDLIAIFRPSVTVDPVTLLRSIMRGQPTDPMVTGYLDAIGNQNGILDIGDYLAWLERNGQILPRLEADPNR